VADGGVTGRTLKLDQGVRRPGQGGAAANGVASLAARLALVVDEQYGEPGARCGDERVHGLLNRARVLLALRR
jgi:hypothetical protein